MDIPAVIIYFTLCLCRLLLVSKVVFFEICNILKGDKRKNCVRFFKIRKYTFLIFEKVDKRKKCQDL